MKKNTLKKILLSIFAFIIIIFLAFLIYASNYYKADNKANSILESENVIQENNLTILLPNKDMDKKIGLIFYPGGKVEDIAYLPLLKELSNKGITCYLVKMPFNLAVFNINAADKIIEKYNEINKWYIGGHSLGGAMTSSYIEKNYNKISGLILLAAYPINNAINNVLCLYGSNDMVLDKTKLDTIQNKIEIKGGNHAFFGNYGNQKGDGTPTITRDEQQEFTINQIINFIN